ncbi:MAG: hypothetical protein R3E12_19135, partial [Candidatus Eisenbacteria bacterium]
PTLLASVMERTVGPRPSFFDVVRAWWRRPESMWEAALACALAAVLIFGKYLPTVDEITRTVEQVAETTGLTGLSGALGTPGEDGHALARPFVDTYTAVRDRWHGVESSAADVSSWTRRVGADLRSGDAEALLGEIRTVLEPLGLYPGNAEDSEDVMPSSEGTLEDETTPPSDSTGTMHSGDDR